MMMKLDLLTTSDPFPHPIMEILNVVSRATDTPLMMPMAGLLGMVSGCLGKNCFYESKVGYQIAGNLFVSLVGVSTRGSANLRGSMEIIWQRYG